MTRFSVCTLGLLFCVTVLVPSALAVDGVVLINQGTAATGVPGCPVSAFPIVLCKSGSYRLSGNLTVGDVNTDAIHVTSSNVSLDLNGFTISGPVNCKPANPIVTCSASGTGIGISDPAKPANNKRNITVRNGTVRGMGNAGIVLPGLGILIDTVHAESNGGASGAGIGIGAGEVTHCTATLNAADGILGGNVSFSDVSRNGRNGIIFAALVSNNNVADNGAVGIQDPTLAVNNTITFNVGFGIVLGSQHGYRSNVSSMNGGGCFSGGVSLGENLCNGTTP
jgi:hypothetical protein